MKKTIIGTLVGGIILFMWQFLSWTALDLHRSAQNYSPKQDTILSYLSANLEKEGGYFLPTAQLEHLLKKWKKLPMCILVNLGQLFNTIVALSIIWV